MKHLLLTLALGGCAQLEVSPHHFLNPSIAVYGGDTYVQEQSVPAIKQVDWGNLYQLPDLYTME